MQTDESASPIRADYPTPPITLDVWVFPLGSIEGARFQILNPDLPKLRTSAGLQLLKDGQDATPTAELQIPIKGVLKSADELLSADGAYPDVLFISNVAGSPKVVTGLASPEVGSALADTVEVAVREASVRGDSSTPILLRAELQFTSGAVGGQAGRASERAASCARKCPGRSGGFASRRS